MSVPTPEQILDTAFTSEQREIVILSMEMGAHEATLFLSLLATSFAARALGPPPGIYPELRMDHRSSLKVTLPRGGT